MFQQDDENQSIFEEEDTDQRSLRNATSIDNKRKRKQYKIKWNQQLKTSKIGTIKDQMESIPQKYRQATTLLPDPAAMKRYSKQIDKIWEIEKVARDQKFEVSNEGNQNLQLSQKSLLITPKFQPKGEKPVRLPTASTFFQTNDLRTLPMPDSKAI